ncbi:hypothetical protein MHZ92_18405 [Sporosarcina sp. ACRSL]|uniref:hypothetical protein n=1 Tax=Sporosarcina sp. ACRSL TaxID=2918215 RepID=UPI001EF656B3|nr:hypothetical protein [Sporosarcina sp. ACRSL]MCG7346088.1 hypothetical protein [Sporosarcina sp. ACRSL]
MRFHFPRKWRIVHKSTKYEGTGATKTFTFKEFDIDEELDVEALKIEIGQIFQAWVWDKLNISLTCALIEER